MSASNIYINTEPPRTLQTFSDIFVTILPPLYGPYFAHLAIESDLNLLAYLTPALFSFVLVSLDNIQSHLENPFDKIGEDDISVSVDHFVDRLQVIRCVTFFMLCTNTPISTPKD